ncbi:hypothetical protein CLU79DRAFT_860486 [Phycomyces nitens]|nr:hypothetical protein CLU79DRAFT_860486 [Phycomyces nitens]
MKMHRSFQMSESYLWQLMKWQSIRIQGILVHVKQHTASSLYKFIFTFSWYKG